MARLGLNEVYAPSGGLTLTPASGYPVIVSAPTDQAVWRVATNAANGSGSGGDFYITISRTAQSNPAGSPDARADCVLTMLNYNVAPGGAKVYTALHGVADHLETYYVTSANERLFERHIAAFTPEGSGVTAQYRPISIYANVAGPASGGGIKINLQSNVTQWLATGAGELAINESFFWIAEDGILLEGPDVKLAQLNNNVALLQQMNVGGTGLVNVAYLDDLDRIVIGQATGGDVLIPRKLTVGDGSFTASSMRINRTDDAGSPEFLRLDNPASTVGGAMIHVSNAGGMKSRSGVVFGTYNRAEFVHEVFVSGTTYDRVFRTTGAGDLEIVGFDSDGGKRRGIIMQDENGVRRRWLFNSDGTISNNTTGV